MRLDLGLLLLRVGAGGMLLFAHGLGKLNNFSTYSEQFPDPLGMGAVLTLIVAIFAEVFCAALVMLGLSTRLACLPIVGTLVTAAVVVHAADPWSKKEFALLYALPFIALLFTGPGTFSLDAMMKLRHSGRP